MPKKAECALEAVLDIALNARPDPVCMADLTKRQQVSKRYLERIMQGLVRADILTGHRGPSGGYRLARERRRITIGEILRTIDTIYDDKASASASVSKRSSNQNRVSELCQELEQEIMKRLDGLTIEDLTLKVEKYKGAHKANKASGLDFNI